MLTTKRLIHRRRKSRRSGGIGLKQVLSGAAAALLLAGSAGCAMLSAPTDGAPPSSSAAEAVSSAPAAPPREPSPPIQTIQSIRSPVALLYDETLGAIVYAKNIDARRYPASTTKLLTALVALEACPPDRVFTVGPEDTAPVMYDASQVGLLEGMELSLRGLLEGLLLRSGCDAAYVISAHVGRILAGDESLTAAEATAVFCQEMNARAAALGAADSHFVNPDGYHHPDHYTTARDLLRIALAVEEAPLLQEILLEKEAEVSLGETTVVWKNGNALLRPDSPYYVPGATGMKTGFTDAAGDCMVASATLQGRRYIGIILGGESADQRWADTVALLKRADPDAQTPDTSSEPTEETTSAASVPTASAS